MNGTEEADAYLGHRSFLNRRTGYVWLVGVAIYLSALGYVGWYRLEDALASVRAPLVLAVVAFEIVALWLRVLKWRVALGANQDAARAFFISKAGGNLTPARVGEFSPMLWARFRNAKVGAWILTDRLFEIAATLLFGLVGLALIGSGRMGALGFWIAGILACVATAGVILTRENMLRRWQERLAGRDRLQKALGLAASLSTEMRRLGPRSAALFGLTLFATGLDLVVGLFLYASLGHWTGIDLLAVAQCLHAITSAIPITPNATGIPYIAAAAFLNQAAQIPLEALALAIPIRFVCVNSVFWPSLWLAVGRGGGPSNEEDQGDLFDRLAAQDVLYEYTPDSLAKLRDLVPDTGLTIDIGCGDGTIGQTFNCQPVVGADISYKCAALSRRRGLLATVSDATKALPFPSHAFDTVTCVDVLHHLGQAWTPIFDEIHRVLKPGGTIVIVEPDARNPFVRLTQAPKSLIRVAPWHDEPAIDPADLEAELRRLHYEFTCEPIHIEGRQVERSVFPLWQRVLKAPFVLLLAYCYRRRPNKFALVARKPSP